MFAQDIFSTAIQDFLSASDDAEIYHSPRYLQLEADRMGGEPCYWVDRKDPSFLIPLISRNVSSKSGNLKDLISPYGYPGFLSKSNKTLNIHRNIRRFSQEAEQCFYVSTLLRLNPFSSSANIGQGKTYRKVEHGHVVYIDLSCEYELLRSQYSQNHRRTLKKLSSLGFGVGWSSIDFLDDFIAIYNQTMTRLGATAYYFFERSYYQSLLDSTDYRFVSVTDADGNLAACGLFFIAADVIQYHLGATQDRFISLAPSKMMFDFVVQQFSSTPHYFVLGGGLGGKIDDLYRFKAGFSALSAPFSTLRIIHNPERYLALCHGSEVLESYGLGDEFFPPYRRPPLVETAS